MPNHRIDKEEDRGYNITYVSQNYTLTRDYSEKYPSGRRGAPAKGVGRETGAGVQIPLSPLVEQGSAERIA